VSRHVVIIGAGIAGLSASFAARARGLDVTIVSSGAGATALGTGAVDDLPWEAWFSAARTLGEPLRLRAVSDEVRAFSDALGLWDLPAVDAHVPLVATAAGRLRPTRGREKGLLDLGSLGKTTVLVPRAPRAGWDADALAATLESEWLARQSGLRFLPVDAPIFRFTDEARIPDADLAMRHDEPARLEWFAERLREMVNEARRGSSSISAVLLGSWLGIKQERATELSLRVGVPVGEVLVGVGSSAGLRFEMTTPKFLERLSVKFVSDRVTKILRTGERIEVVLATAVSSIVADAIVLATGGVSSGSIVYSPPDLQAGEQMPSHIEPSFSFAIQTPDIPITLGCDGDRFDAGSSVFGPPLDTTAWPSSARPSTLESVGIEASDGKVCPGVYAAGDVIAGKRRTILDAVTTGLRAGRTV
jgi:glycerol-3-phosphate dehydrogenase subunit B